MDIIGVERGSQGPGNDLAGFGIHDDNGPTLGLGFRNRPFQGLLRDVLDDFINRQMDRVAGEGLEFSLPLRNDLPPERVSIQNHPPGVPPEKGIVADFQPLKTLVIDSCKSEDVGQQRPLRIKPPRFNEGIHSINGKVLHPVLRMVQNFPLNPDKIAFFVPQLLLHVLLRKVHQWCELASHEFRVVNGTRRGIHGRHVKVQRQRLALSIKNGAPTGIKRNSLFMLTASFLHHRGGLQHLKIKKTNEEDGKDRKKT